MTDGTAENEHVFIRGSHRTLGEEVPRRFLEGLGGDRFAPPEQGSGRLELARQIASPDNPLFARVMVNRLWHHHFGAGLVRSPDDFGVMGQRPRTPSCSITWRPVRARWLVAQARASPARALQYVPHVERAACGGRPGRCRQQAVASNERAAA